MHFILSILVRHTFKSTLGVLLAVPEVLTVLVVLEADMAKVQRHEFSGDDGSELNINISPNISHIEATASSMATAIYVMASVVTINSSEGLRDGIGNLVVMSHTSVMYDNSGEFSGQPSGPPSRTHSVTPVLQASMETRVTPWPGVDKTGTLRVVKQTLGSYIPKPFLAVQ